MKAFIVGGAGFIGSHLVDRLVAEDHAVDVLDNLTSGSLANLAEARSVGGALKFHHLDAASSEMDSSVGARSPEVVYHLALLAHRATGPTDAGDALTSLLAVLEAARRHAVAKVVVALPADVVYGHPQTKSIPLKERDPGALEGRGVRGVVACALLDLLVHYRDAHAVEFAAVLLPTVYGTRQRVDANVVASLVSAARSGIAPTITGDGRQTRDLLYVDDAVDALVRAAVRGGGLAINVGTGVQTSVNDLWTRVARVTGADVAPLRAPARPDELQRFALSPVRARIHLGWSPWTDVDDGLSRTAGS